MERDPAGFKDKAGIIWTPRLLNVTSKGRKEAYEAVYHSNCHLPHVSSLQYGKDQRDRYKVIEFVDEYGASGQGEETYTRFRDKQRNQLDNAEEIEQAETAAGDSRGRVVIRIGFCKGLNARVYKICLCDRHRVRAQNATRALKKGTKMCFSVLWESRFRDDVELR